MNPRKHSLLLLAALAAIITPLYSSPDIAPPSQCSSPGFTDAGLFGFSPQAKGADNTKALQSAVDRGGTITVSKPGIYQVAGTVYVGSNTSLILGAGVFLKKVADKGPFSHVLLNKGARTKTYDEHISIEGLQIIVNGVDARTFKDAYGLHGQLAFFYVKDLRISGFRCLDLGHAQYGIQICTFEDITVEDAIIKGEKDGVHLGRGKRFTIRRCEFQTGDDAVALNAHDYAVGNPELGWIEDGIVENCHDLPDPTQRTGYFCRILAGAWIDWKSGMQVQQSDTVVSNGRLYRVQANADGRVYTSTTQPTHENGSMELDGIKWGVVQNDVTHTCGVRNVTFRDIFLENPRTSFSVHFDTGKYSRSYYPGAEIPKQEGIVLDDVRVLHTERTEFLHIATPIDSITVMNSSLRNSPVHFVTVSDFTTPGKTLLNFVGCTFLQAGRFEFLKNDAPNKSIVLQTSASSVIPEDFSASISPGTAVMKVTSDLPGLTK